MKKTNLFLLGGALLFSVACTNTTTEGTTATTAETTTDATMGTTGTAGATGTAGTTGTTATGTTSADVTTMTDMNDPTFLMTAASSNLFEIQAGKMAAQNASNAEVKQFGQMMVDHHTKATQELTTLAQSLSTEVPTMLMPIHQEMLDKLKGKTGAAFDEAYMDLMETAHEMDIAMFTVKSNAADNASVKAFATKTLPMLKSHREQAGTLEDKVD